jgi:peptide/nickel transport system permease protein
MTTFLIRRLLQMIVVIVLASIVSYALLYLAPGGPAELDPRRQQSGRSGLREEDIARLKAHYELDLSLVVRFTRWFIGFPDGPVTLGGQTFFADVQVGCAQPAQERWTYPDGTVEIVEVGCREPITMADLADRRTSRGIVFGDFGRSQVILRDQPVSEVIGSRLWYTVALMGISTLITLIIAIPIGIYSAVRQYSRFDYIMTTVAFIGSSLPVFFFGIVLILLLSILPKDIGDVPYILPPGNATASRDYDTLLFGRIEAGSTADYALHFIMPCAVLTFINIAQWSRFVRSSMLEVLGQDYVRTSRAKGVRERLVILKHAFRNALIPIITLLANILPVLVAGAAITENVFNWPGLGQLLLESLSRYDYTVAMALLYITIVLQLVGYLLSDILYTVADPRIRLS